ncbi:MAG: hypothetical protein Q9174_003779 [Haloplaca sp. 1 TL-2023]
MVKSFGDEQFCGCTGCPADSHTVKWLTTSRERPVERCTECGSVYKMEYVGPPDDPHDDHHHRKHRFPLSENSRSKEPEDHLQGTPLTMRFCQLDEKYEEPKTFADFVRPEYRWN